MGNFDLDAYINEEAYHYMLGMFGFSIKEKIIAITYDE